VMTPRRPPARSGKDVGKAAAVERTAAGAPATQVRAVFHANAQKGRIMAPTPAPQTGMQLHTAGGIRKYRHWCTRPVWGW
jgi:hypothetical protein